MEDPPWLSNWDVNRAKPKFFWPISETYLTLLQEGGSAGLAATAALHTEKPNYAVYELVRAERTYKHIEDLTYNEAQDAIANQDNQLDLEGW